MYWQVDTQNILLLILLYEPLIKKYIIYCLAFEDTYIFVYLMVSSEYYT